MLLLGVELAVSETAVGQGRCTQTVKPKWIVVARIDGLLGTEFTRLRDKENDLGWQRIRPS